MGFEEELFHELATNTWDKRSRMQQEMVKGAKGEPFAVQELYRNCLLYTSPSPRD